VHISRGARYGLKMKVVKSGQTYKENVISKRLYRTITYLTDDYTHSDSKSCSQTSGIAEEKIWSRNYEYINVQFITLAELYFTTF
jgi:hypothetical protein